ncbi:nephrocystin-3-like [Ruditapes philippinarum]|uniref:nephrocystin-3-like n=1 Tax=Ruditapes philippinarum TaxID=129788 RepID=UPI00295B722E|nr:nephrocystin-3-like [Ruditapes philippinarum]
MGNGASFLRSQDDDDILGTDLDGSSKGVIKRIPIEMKPRGKLGNKITNSVLRKPKGGSLRSALSIDLENPEVERIRREYEIYRLNTENEIQNTSREKTKLETDNKRLRAELTVLQRTCNNMRQERDAAYEEKLQALARAAAFEHDRDKVQRVFKIFRETKESEIQNLLRAKRELENKLSKVAHGYLPEDTDTTSRTGIDSNSSPGDWWTNVESESSMGSTVQLHQSTLRGPEFASSMMEFDGPFTNVNKEDWSSALATLNQIVPIIPEQSLSCSLRLYISAPKDAQSEVDMFMKEYRPRLSSLCNKEGRSLVTIHLQYDDQDNNLEMQLRCRKHHAQKSSIFLAFLGDNSNRFTALEYKCGHLDHPGNKTAIFCFREIKGSKSNSEARELRNQVRDSGSAKIIDGYPMATKGAELAYKELEKIIEIELGLESKKTEDDEFEVREGDITDMKVDGVFDANYNYEQMEAFNYAVKSSCELNFEKHYERLNAHVLSAGPLPPLLILSPSGAGRSLLLCKWIQLQIEKAPGSVVLHHFVGSDNSLSADPVVMIRRITSQLMQHVTSPPSLTFDPTRLVEEFPRWLEKISSRTNGGVILVLDSIDRFHQAETHLKWLLDPLPVDARVIVSASEETCPQSWRSWPTLQVEPLSNKNVKELLRAELVTLGASLNNEDETKVLTHCRNNPTCIPLYVMVLSRHTADCSKNESKVTKHLDALLTSSDCVGLYIKVLELVKTDLESQETRGFTRNVLRYLYVSRGGLSENELLELVPGLTWSFLAPFCYLMHEHLVLKYQGGLLMFAHEQVIKAVHDFCFGKDEQKVISQIRQDLIQHFQSQMSGTKASCRVSEELPWLLCQEGEKEDLKSCILDMFVFQKICARGRLRELLHYWSYMGEDKANMAKAYLSATKHMEDSVSQYNGQVTLPDIADLYETLGKFLKDLGQLNQALSALQRALEVRETALDPDHPIVAHSLHQLANLHAHWNKYPTAEALFKQALEIYQNAFTSEHVMVAKELDALAILYQKQDKHDQADPLRKKAMSIRRGTRTPRSATPRAQGMEPLRKRTLQLEGLCMGSDSADLARTLNEIGVLHYLQNDFDNAESFFKRSLEMRENVLGPDHLDLSQSLNNLAALYNDRKLYSKAEPLYERTLKIRMKNLNSDHPSIASVIKHLALLYRKQGKFEKAEPLYVQAVEIREKSFGPQHPSVATALVNLAVLYSQQNKHNEAEPLYTRALKIYEESLGAHHPRVAETLRNLAVLKYDQKDFETAAKLYKRATEIKENDGSYAGKELISRRSSSGETNSTVKNLLHP